MDDFRQEDEIVVKRIARQLLKQLIKDQSIKISVKGIEIEYGPQYEQSHDGCLIRIIIATNNRPLVCGNFGGLPINGLFGLNAEFISGYLGGYFAARGRNISFHIDVWSEPVDASFGFQNIISFVTRKDALRHHIIQHKSPIDLIMMKHALRYLELIGPGITGPDPPTLELVEDVAKELKPKTFADLFCGTGAVTKVVLENNSKCRAVCVDAFTIAIAKQTLQNFLKQTTLIKSNIFTTGLEGSFELVFADPFDYLALDFAKEVVPKIAKRCDTLIMSHGFTRDGFWAESVRRELRRIFSTVRPVDRGGVSFSRCE